MILDSHYKELCSVTLPYSGRQRYMHGFDAANPKMEEGFEDYLEPVRALLRSAGVSFGKCWMTVDEKIVLAGQSQRRPGPHVDGKFNMKAASWGGGGGGWNHSCNLVPVSRTPVILASSVPGCRAWEGRFEATPRHDGDLSHIQNELGEGAVLPAGVGFLLSGDCVHESMIMEHEVQRTFLRIALPQLEASND